jgi:hypothetical protein
MDDEAAELWDAHAEYNVGVMISCHLHERPDLSGRSDLAHELRALAGYLEHAGRAHLRELGERPLRAV